MLKLSNRFLLLSLMAGFALAVVVMFLLDQKAYELFHSTFENQRELWEAITFIGNSSWMGVICIIAIIVGVILDKTKNSPVGLKTWRSSVFTFFTVAIIGLAALFIKNTIGRARPYLFETEGPISFAPFAYDPAFAEFPSGHTTTAFSLAAALTILYPRAALPAFAIAALAGFSRMAIDAHYFADVIAGATFGTICTIFFAKWLAPKLKI